MGAASNSLRKGLTLIWRQEFIFEAVNFASFTMVDPTHDAGEGFAPS